MDFTFDLSQTPLLERKNPSQRSEKSSSLASASPRRSVSLSPADSGSVSGWKRPWMCQVSILPQLLSTELGSTVGCRLKSRQGIIQKKSADSVTVGHRNSNEWPYLRNSQP